MNKLPVGFHWKASTDGLILSMCFGKHIELLSFPPTTSPTTFKPSEHQDQWKHIPAQSVLHGLTPPDLSIPNQDILLAH